MGNTENHAIAERKKYQRKKTRKVLQYFKHQKVSSFVTRILKKCILYILFLNLEVAMSQKNRF